MKANERQFMPVSVQWKGGFSFIRKGAVGDGQSAIDAQQGGAGEAKAAYEAMIAEIKASNGGSLPAWITELGLL
jgi:hypothetical protein